MKRLLLFTMTLLLLSCGDLVETQQMTDEEIAKSEELGVIIQDAFTYNQSQNIIDLFDSKKFSRRLGRGMITKKGYAPKFILDIIDDTFERSIRDLVNSVYNEGKILEFIDYHKKDDVIRLVYALNGSKNQNVYNYFVFYVSPDAGRNFEIVNFYNVSSGMSLGQNLKQYTTREVNTNFFIIGLEKANIKFNEALLLMEQKQYQAAYNILDEMEPKFKVLNSFAYTRMICASYLDNETSIKEMEFMKTYTPNDQSKAFYDCLINSVNGATDEDQIECQNEILEMLFTT